MAKRASRPRHDARTVRGAIAVCALLGCGCTAVIDSDAEQCQTRDDCGAFPGTICIDRACVVPPPGTPGECRAHEDCSNRHGDRWICRRSDEVCVPLESEHCRTVFGDYGDDNAIFIGSLLQTEGEYDSTGRPAENAVRLAIMDFEQSSNGLPPVPGSTARRPLVLIGCNSGADPIAAARHLAEVVRVPAIVGASFSGVTIQVATDVTIPNGVLLLSPSATSAAITRLQDGGLVWRTSPSDDIQALALIQLVPRLELRVRQELALPAAESIRLAIVHKGDSYGRGLAASVEAGLWYNGKPATDNGEDYLRLDYGDPSTRSTTAYEETVDELLSSKPHIVLMFGTTEGVSEVLAPVEQRWSTTSPSAAHRPRYVFADGGVVNELWTFVADDDGLRRRILGTIPGTDNELFGVFRSNYLSVFHDGTSPDVFGAAGGYDATYLLAYAMATLGGVVITGTTLAQGLAALAPPGHRAEAGFDSINGVLETIAQQQPVDFEGASGPLDFDASTGEAPSDIQVWCLPEDKSGLAAAAVKSGLYLNAKTGLLAGEQGSVCD